MSSEVDVFVNYLVRIAGLQNELEQVRAELAKVVAERDTLLQHIHGYPEVSGDYGRVRIAQAERDKARAELSKLEGIDKVCDDYIEQISRLSDDLELANEVIAAGRPLKTNDPDKLIAHINGYAEALAKWDARR